MKFAFSRRILLFLAVVVLCMGAIALAAFGYYPILIVNGSPVFAAKFFQHVRAMSLFQERVAQAYPKAIRGSPPSREELEAGVLDGLVEERLLNQSIRREVGREADGLVEEKLQGLIQEEAKFGKATEALYGLSLGEFRQEVLVPQAERDIVKGRLFLRGESIDDWAEANRRAARVTVLSTRFKWDGEKIVAK